jgi:hypothetical protein
MAQRFEDTYPTITHWVTEIVRIEIGQDEMSRSFVRAIDEGGMIWEGRERYATLEEALQDLEAGIAAWIHQNL